jgi:hypothetical protein
MKFIAVTLFLIAMAAALAGCDAQAVDAFCTAHSKAEFVFHPAVVHAMNSVEKRNYLKILEYGSQVCGWR